MWELDYKESWAPKNWCFWTVVLEKTPLSPLDCKGIEPVHPKGNQSWILIGRTDAEAGTPIFWLPDEDNWLTGKDLDAGKDWLKAGGEGDNRGWDGWMASPTQWTWVWVSSACWWWTGRPGVLQSMGSQRVGHDWATELTVIGLFRVLFLLESVLVICVFLGICPFHLNCLIYWYTADHSISFYFCRVSNDSSFIPNFSNESSLFVSWPVWHISVLFIFSKNFLFC